MVKKSIIAMLIVLSNTGCATPHTILVVPRTDPILECRLFLHPRAKLGFKHFDKPSHDRGQFSYLIYQEHESLIPEIQTGHAIVVP